MSEPLPVPARQTLDAELEALLGPAAGRLAEPAGAAVPQAPEDAAAELDSRIFAGLVSP